MQINEFLNLIYTEQLYPHKYLRAKSMKAQQVRTPVNG